MPQMIFLRHYWRSPLAHAKRNVMLFEETVNHHRLPGDASDNDDDLAAPGRPGCMPGAGALDIGSAVMGNGMSPVARMLARANKSNNNKQMLSHSVEELSAATGNGQDPEPAESVNLSRSVPDLLASDESEKEDETDSMTENYNFRLHRKTGSTVTSHTVSSFTSSSASVSSSMMSLYSEAGDFGSVSVTGEVEFSLSYEDRRGELLVHVNRCRGLAAAHGKKNRSDPYVKIYLLPDKSRQSKRKTMVKKKTLEPMYSEVLRYKVDRTELRKRVLNLSVWHNDTFGRNIFLGEVNLILNSWDWANHVMNWYTLQPKDFTSTEPAQTRGQILIGLKFIPANSIGGQSPPTGEIHIWIKQANNVLPHRAQGVDSFVKCYILPDTSRKSRQKTRVIRKSINPEYNHTMVYDGFRDQDVLQACVELTVWDHERFSTNQFLGGVRLGNGTGMSYGQLVEWMDSRGEERRLFEEMVSRPGEWVEGVLPLRTNMATTQDLK
ncbi:synaptotagmin-like protein 2 isoform X1 [Petromyzon marinus]|uniref:synaptotagmin-like protein 2 isoform X1 n=1 Tax=Petromyzon marinus TaxID=7757 RepID=UPI003F6EB0CE